jgi:parallel beta-helix repeat protein
MAGNLILGDATSGISYINGATHNTCTNNQITLNQAQGIWVGDNGYDNRFTRNTLTANGALGIDLAPAGINANMSGSSSMGANKLQNYPVLTDATSDGVRTWFVGTLPGSSSDSYPVEFFASTACDPSGNGEAEIFVGATTVAGSDSSATSTFVVSFPGAYAGKLATATAYKTDNGTSELSACRAIRACPVITLGSSMLPIATTGTPYAQTLTASGGTGPYSFVRSSGVLPYGVTLGASGTLSGTPNFPGSYSFTVTTVDANGCRGQADFNILVVPPGADLSAIDFASPVDLSGPEDGGVGLPPDDLGAGGCRIGARSSDAFAIPLLVGVVLLALGLRRRTRSR